MLWFIRRRPCFSIICIYCFRGCDAFPQLSCTCLPPTLRFPPSLCSDLSPSPPLEYLRPLPAASTHSRLDSRFLFFSVAISRLAMNTSDIMSPPSILINDMNNMNGPRNSSSRTAHKNFSRSSGPMAVPNAHREDQYVPPPLPPPRHMEDLAAGSDPGWRWGNSSNHGGFGGGKFDSSISSSSSLRGSWDSRMEDEGFSDRPDPSRRNLSITSTNLPPSLDRKYDFSRHIDEGYHSFSGSSLSSNRSVPLWLSVLLFGCIFRFGAIKLAVEASQALGCIRLLRDIVRRVPLGVCLQSK